MRELRLDDPDLTMIRNDYVQKERVQDDPNFPWRLKVKHAIGEFLAVTTQALYGVEPTLIIGGRTEAALKGFMQRMRFDEVPLVTGYILTDPQGKVVDSYSRPVR